MVGWFNERECAAEQYCEEAEQGCYQGINYWVLLVNGCGFCGI